MNSGIHTRQASMSGTIIFTRRNNTSSSILVRALMCTTGAGQAGSGVSATFVGSSAPFSPVSNTGQKFHPSLSQFCWNLPDTIKFNLKFFIICFFNLFNLSDLVLWLTFHYYKYDLFRVADTLCQVRGVLCDPDSCHGYTHCLRGLQYAALPGPIHTGLHFSY